MSRLRASRTEIREQISRHVQKLMFTARQATFLKVCRVKWMEDQNGSIKTPTISMKHFYTFFMSNYEVFEVFMYIISAIKLTCFIDYLLVLINFLSVYLLH